MYYSSLPLRLWIVSTLIYSVSAATQDTLIGIVGSDFVLLGADSAIRQSIAITNANHDKINVISHNTAIAAAGNVADTDRCLADCRYQSTLYELNANENAEIIVDCSSNTVQKATLTTMPVGALASFARQLIASKMRTSTPLQVNLLIAGMARKQSVQQRTIPHDAQLVAINSQVAGSGNMAERLQSQIRTASSEFVTEKNDNNAEVEETDNDPLLTPCLYWLDEYGALQCLRYGSHGYGSNFILSILDQGYRTNMTRGQAVQLLQSCFAQLRERYVINSPNPPCIKCIDANGCSVISSDSDNKMTTR